MENLSFETSQNVQLNYRLASVGERILAFYIDLFVMGSVVTLLIMGLMNAKMSGGAASTLVLIPFAFYHLILESVFQGQTPGMMAMKIKVVADGGGQVTFGKYLIRWIMRLVDIWITGGILAIVFIVISKKGQRIGDIVAGTSMISTKMKPVFNLEMLTKVPEGYEPVFQQAIDLDLQHIKTLHEVMKFYTENPDKHEAILMVYTAQKNLKIRWGIETDMRPERFIETVIKDYNALNRKVAV